MENVITQNDVDQMKEDQIRFAGQQVPVLVIEPTLEDAFKLDQHIKYLKSELVKAENEKKQIISDHIKSNKMQEGSFRIKDQPRNIRTLDARKFRELYPNEFNEIVETSIPIGKAEAAI